MWLVHPSMLLGYLVLLPSVYFASLLASRLVVVCCTHLVRRLHLGQVCVPVRLHMKCRRPGVTFQKVNIRPVAGGDRIAASFFVLIDSYSSHSAQMVPRGGKQL